MVLQQGHARLGSVYPKWVKGLLPRRQVRSHKLLEGRSNIMSCCLVDLLMLVPVQGGPETGS